MRSSFIDHVGPSLLCTDIVSLFTLIKSANPSLHDHYSLHRYYGRLSHPLTLSISLALVGACTFNTPFLTKMSYGFPKFSRTSLYPRWRLRSRGLDTFGFVSLTSRVLLPANTAKLSARPKYVHFETYNVHPCGFRLEYFSVYASTNSLPPELQDSIHGAADFRFHGGTFTRKMCAAFLGARLFSTLGHFVTSGLCHNRLGHF